MASAALPTQSPLPAPAQSPPLGEQPAAVDPESLQKWNVVVVTVCLTTTSALFFLRSFVRLFIKRNWIFEDYLCLVSWCGLVSWCACMTTTISRHGGVHQWELTQGEMNDALYWYYITSIVYGPVICTTKLAVLFLYRRVFSPRAGSHFDIFLLSIMAILVAFYLAITLAKVFECTPIPRSWDKTHAGTCIDVGALLNASGLFNTVTDVAILLIPVKSVWGLNMKFRQKLGVVMIFTLGSVAPVFSMIGFIVREQVSSSSDVTYNQPSILLWATAEITTGIICVCLPETGALRSSRRRAQRAPRNLIGGTGGNTSRETRAHALEASSQNRKSKCGGMIVHDEEFLDPCYVELSESESSTRQHSSCSRSHSRSVQPGTASVPELPKTPTAFYGTASRSSLKDDVRTSRPQSGLGQHAPQNQHHRSQNVEDEGIAAGTMTGLSEGYHAHVGVACSDDYLSDDCFEDAGEGDIVKTVRIELSRD